MFLQLCECFKVVTRSQQWNKKESEKLVSENGTISNMTCDLVIIENYLACWSDKCDKVS